MVDALGGVDIEHADRACSTASRRPRPGGAWIRIDLKPGLQHLTALQTFAYVRARSQSVDYARIARQRCVLAAVAERANARRLLRNFRRLAATMRRSVGTDISLQSLPDIIELRPKMTPGASSRSASRRRPTRSRATARTSRASARPSKNVIDHPPAAGTGGTFSGGVCGR